MCHWNQNKKAGVLQICLYRTQLSSTSEILLMRTFLFQSYKLFLEWVIESHDLNSKGAGRDMVRGLPPTPVPGLPGPHRGRPLIPLLCVFAEAASAHLNIQVSQLHTGCPLPSVTWVLVSCSIQLQSQAGSLSPRCSLFQQRSSCSVKFLRIWRGAGKEENVSCFFYV